MPTYGGIRSQKQASECYRCIDSHEGHTQLRLVRKPGHCHGPDDTEEIWRCTKQEHGACVVAHCGQDDLDEIRKRINWSRAAQEHQAIHPELPISGVSEHFGACELVGLSITTIALDSIEHNLKFTLRESSIFTGSEHIVWKADNEEIPKYCDAQGRSAFHTAFHQLAHAKAAIMHSHEDPAPTSNSMCAIELDNSVGQDVAECRDEQVD